MTRYKSHTMQEYETFLRQPFNSNFGISDDKIIQIFLASAGAQAVIQSYGVDENFIRYKLFPELDKRNLGHFMFLFITMCEGGGAGNWINHYAVDSSPDGLVCAIVDMDYIVTCLTTGYPLCVSAPECIKPWVEDNAGAAQAFYASAPQTSIAGYYMCSTFAGNAWVWATNWCEQNQGPVPLIYFGNPYDDIMNKITSMGGNISNGGGTGTKPPNTSQSQKPPSTQKPNVSAPILTKNLIYLDGETNQQEKTGIFFNKLNDRTLLPQFNVTSSNGVNNDHINQNQKPPTKPPINPTESNSEVWDYVQTLLGKNVGVGQNYGECYGLAYNIIKHFTGYDLIGGMNAKDIGIDYPWGTGALSSFQSFTNVDQNGSQLKRGDIMCLVGTGYGVGGGYINMQYGHVVVVSKVAGGQIEWIDQNKWGNHEVVQLEPISYTQTMPYFITSYIRKVK